VTTSTGTSAGDPSSPDKASDRYALPVLLLSVFISVIGFGIVVPMLPFFAEVFGAPTWQVTLLFATYSLGQFAGELFWGRLSDRVGRRPVLLLTMALSIAGYLALAFAPGIWLAIVARGAAGFFAGNMSVIQSYVVSVSPRERLSSRLGLIGVAYGIGFVVGPALGGLLAHPEAGSAGLRPPLLVAAALCMAATSGVLFFVREGRRGPVVRAPAGKRFSGLVAAYQNVMLRRLLGASFFAFAAFSAVWSTLGLWCQARFGWGPREIGAAIALAGGAAAVGQGLLAGVSARRLGEVMTSWVALIATAGLLLLTMFSPFMILSMAALTGAVMAHSLCQPCIGSLVSRAVTPQQQGSALGANAAASALARVVGPSFAGGLFSLGGPDGPFVFAALGMLPAAWLVLTADRQMPVGSK